MTALLCVVASLAIGAEGTTVTDSRAREAINRFSQSVQDAAVDFDRRVKRAREKLIGELSAAATANKRSNNEVEARRIEQVMSYQQETATVADANSSTHR